MEETSNPQATAEVQQAPEVQASSAQSTANASLNNNDKPDLMTLMDISMPISIEIGRAKLKLKELLNLSKGAIIELDKLSGEPLDILANGKLIAHGEVISMNGKYGVRLTDVPKKIDMSNDN